MTPETTPGCAAAAASGGTTSLPRTKPHLGLPSGLERARRMSECVLMAKAEEAAAHGEVGVNPACAKVMHPSLKSEDVELEDQ